MYEAVDAGVPVLGFPLFYDQPRNMGNLVEAGMALSMDLLTVNKNSFLEKINELINNKRYVKLYIKQNEFPFDLYTIALITYLLNSISDLLLYIAYTFFMNGFTIIAII